MVSCNFKDNLMEFSMQLFILFESLQSSHKMNPRDPKIIYEYNKIHKTYTFYITMKYTEIQYFLFLGSINAFYSQF